MAEKHHVVLMYSTPQVGLLGFGNTEATDEMAMIYNFESDRILYHDLVFIPLPKKPPDGILLDTIMFSLIAGIYACIVGRGYIWLLCRLTYCKMRHSFCFKALETDD